MSRKRRRPSASPVVSLFPFLAVLICTMGVLIVMLVLAVQSSSVKADQAKQDHQQDVAKQRDALVSKLDLQQFRVEQIAKIRPDVQQRLEDAKLGRSHLDDEIRKLTQQAKQLQAQFVELQSDQQIAVTSTDYELEKIEQLQASLATREQEVVAMRTKVAGQPALYSIVPTQTANGTSRRPIYVECTTAGINLQPSGIKIPLSNFTRPIMPGNPLDAALLATREHWNKFDAGSSEGEPYPLIVVRPGGATSYAIARRAMSSWDDEFGYELVEAEKELDWGAADTHLTENVTQAIDIAMLRQQQRVDQRLAEWMGPRGTRRFAASNSGTAGGNGNSQTPSSLVSNATSQATANAPTSGSNDANQFSATSQNSSGGNFDTTPDDSLSRFAGNHQQWRPELNASEAENGSNPLRQFSNQQFTSATRSQASSQISSQANSQSLNTTNSQANTPMNTGGQGQQTTAGSPIAVGSPGNVEPLAGKRGNDWALPTRTPGATPYRRPIRVECRGDQYIVFPSDPALQPFPVVVESSASIDESIDQLIHQVWKQIEGWGMAEAGGYWKPVLRLAPDQSGLNRAEELARKLEGSGMEIERLWR